MRAHARKRQRARVSEQVSERESLCVKERDAQGSLHFDTDGEHRRIKLAIAAPPVTTLQRLHASPLPLPLPSPPLQPTATTVTPQVLLQKTPSQARGTAPPPQVCHCQ